MPSFKPTDTQIFQALGRRSSDMLKFWPVIAALGLALMSYAELRFQVYQNTEDLDRIHQMIDEAE